MIDAQAHLQYRLPYPLKPRSVPDLRHAEEESSQFVAVRLLVNFLVLLGYEVIATHADKLRIVLYMFLASIDLALVVILDIQHQPHEKNVVTLMPDYWHAMQGVVVPLSEI